MKRGGAFWLFIILELTLLPQYAVGQKNPEKLFLEIKELSGLDPNLAETKVKDYIQLGLELKSEKMAANAYYLLGRINYFKSRNFISNEYYAMAINSPYAKKDLTFAESCHNNMGVNYEMQGFIPQAMEAYLKSLRYAELLKDSVSMGQTLINIGLLNIKAKKFKQAEKLTRQALDFFSRNKDTFNLALCYQNLGFLLSEQQDPKNAIKQYLISLELHKRADNQFEILNSLFNLGSNYSDLDMFLEAEIYLQQTLELAKTQDRRDIIAKVYVQRGENATDVGKYAEAEANLLEARKLIEENEIIDLYSLLFRMFSNLYAKSGKIDLYNKITDEGIEFSKKQAYLESLARTDEVQAMYEFQKNIQLIKNQEKNIEEKKTQLYLLIGLLTFLAIVLTIFVFQYLKARKYMRSLFESKLEKSLHHIPIGASNEKGRNHLKEIYDSIIEQVGKSEFSDLASLSKDLGITEEDAAEAIRLFGAKGLIHPFFQTFFIDELCKKMIAMGKNISLKAAVDNSPFSNFNDFARRFQEVTGLRPEQFIQYCDTRLKERSKQHY